MKDYVYYGYMMMSMFDVIWMVWYAPQVCFAVLPSIPASEQSRSADSAMNKCHARHARFKESTSAGTRELQWWANWHAKHTGGLKHILGICEHRIKKRRRIRNC